MSSSLELLDWMETCIYNNDDEDSYHHHAASFKLMDLLLIFVTDGCLLPDVSCHGKMFSDLKPLTSADVLPI